MFFKKINSENFLKSHSLISLFVQENKFEKFHLVPFPYLAAYLRNHFKNCPYHPSLISLFNHENKFGKISKAPLPYLAAYSRKRVRKNSLTATPLSRCLSMKINSEKNLSHPLISLLVHENTSTNFLKHPSLNLMLVQINEFKSFS